ncbi:uncharacterized protein IL334_003986 [Kwoniella shivajii]|uniref:Dynactin subunit 6 n=1 Tax=Kwoniella shivajii TaxID=564305 RepID=A0ABZ1CZG8_9TREE|nr:hypothetical protein IL334_003986 [Kwoniella shivajii]
MSRAAAPPTKITSHSSCMISQDTDIRGDIAFDEGTIVHPKSSILALGGAISFGKNCIIEEGVIIVNRGKDTMKIGDSNHFMVGCRIESPSIGEWNTFQPRSTCSSGVIISDNCTLSAGTTLLHSLSSSASTSESMETLPPCTVIYGSNSDRRVWDGTGQKAGRNLREKHLEYLREIIPKYNRIRPNT